MVWVVDKKVPGGVIKYTWLAPSAWTSAPEGQKVDQGTVLVLERYGKGARSELGITNE